MKLWKISQNKNIDYDTFDSAVVACETEIEAKTWPMSDPDDWETWVTPEHVKVEYLGEAANGLERGVIVASFNAG